MTRPNVVLIVMDTARAQSVLGRPDVAPNLHRLAGDGCTFTNAFTTAPWTLPSHASLFTGQYTSEHGIHAGARAFDPSVDTLAERLRASGYRTAAFSNNTWVSPEFGFDRGFDQFEVGWKLVDGGTDLAAVARSHQSTRDRLRAVSGRLLDGEAPRTLVNAAYSKFLRTRYDDGALLTNWRVRRWLSAHGDDQPFFLFANYLEPHLEYDPPERFREEFLPDDVDPGTVDEVNQDAWAYLAGTERMTETDFRVLRGLYDAELAYLDHRIGALVDRLDEQGLLEDTAVFVTGDHGENVGEHGLMDHQYCLYDTLLHVPLFARYPGAFDGGDERTDLVELRDLYPTILDLAECSADRNGTTAPRCLLDASGRDAVYAEYRTPQPSMAALEERVGELDPSVRRYDRSLRAVRTRSWKCIEGSDGSTELYDVREDPAETDDLADEHPEKRAELTTRMEEVLRSEIDGTVTEAAETEASGTEEAAEAAEAEEVAEDGIDAATEQRLEDMGYLQ